MGNRSPASKELKLPLSSVLPENTEKFAREAEVVFRKDGNTEIRSEAFIFQEGTLVKSDKKFPKDLQFQGIGASFPVFSAIAVLLLVLFRNFFHQSFLKYFISVRNNYEIDFSIQKIGIPATILAACINILAFSDFIRNWLPLGSVQSVFFAIQLLLFPMLISAVFLFFTSISIRFFPLVFPDLKIQLFLSILILGINFYLYGQGGRVPVFSGNLPLYLFSAFFIYRSFIFLEVLGKYYRYQTTVSLFYICSLNLATCIAIHKVLL
jgi:hypothetical protein